jgi:hypothetical protein
VFEEGGDVNEFCRRTGMPKDIVYARASEYRQAGVRLPKLRRANAADNEAVHRLNELLGVGKEEYEGHTVDRLLGMVAAMPD